MADFAPELDRYERDLAVRVGPALARERRRELEAHLAADLAARIEGGVPEPEARTQALAALGSLDALARAEPLRPETLGRILLFAAPWFAATAWFLPQWIVMRSGVPMVPMTEALVVAYAACVIAGSFRAHGLAWREIALGSLANAVAMLALLALASPRPFMTLGLSSSWELFAYLALGGFAQTLLPHLALVRYRSRRPQEAR